MPKPYYKMSAGSPGLIINELRLFAINSVRGELNEKCKVEISIAENDGFKYTSVWLRAEAGNVFEGVLRLHSHPRNVANVGHQIMAAHERVVVHDGQDKVFQVWPVFSEASIDWKDTLAYQKRRFHFWNLFK
jgi:hypothetical protein